MGGHIAVMQAGRVHSHVEERMVRQGELDMRLVINRSHGHMRMMDFRAGNYDDKRAMLDSLARQERLSKIFTVVEKQDSNSWRSAGFVREGVYPSFFRTADAYMMSRVYADDGAPMRIEPLKASPEELTKFPGRRLSKPEGLTIVAVTEEAARATLLAQANGDLRAVPFAHARAPDLVLQAKSRGTRKVFGCSEFDESFAHATIGFSPTPSSEGLLVLCAYLGDAMLKALGERDVANVFGMAPVTDRWSNELFAGLGFRVTGRLARHLHTEGGRQNALLWHRKLVDPAGESEQQGAEPLGG